MSRIETVILWGVCGSWLYVRLTDEEEGRDYTLTGVAESLWEARGFAPVGILLDRLQECPAECEAPAEVVSAAVEWLRERHPNGV